MRDEAEPHIEVAFPSSSAVHLLRGDNCVEVAPLVYRSLLSRLSGGRLGNDFGDEAGRLADSALEVLTRPMRGAQALDSSVAIDGDTVPLQVGDYLVTRPLGTGTFGAVYEGYDLITGEVVALKWLRSQDPWAIDAFKNEARYLADVVHPALVAPDEIVEVKGRLALIMPLVRGREF